MSQPPTVGMSKLSLESMPINTRSRSHRQDEPSAGPSRLSSGQAHRDPDDERDSDDDQEPDYIMEEEKEEDEVQEDEDEDEDDTQEDTTVIRSPSRLKYDIRKLSTPAQERVRSLYEDVSREPGNMALQWCQRLTNAAGEPEHYAFQLHEVVRHSVRIGSPDSGYSEPTCTCEQDTPCRHLLFLHDQITKQTLYDHDPEEPLTLTESGYAEELQAPFAQIAKLHLAVLAGGLGCDVWSPDHSPVPSPARIQRALDVVSCFADPDQRDDTAVADYIEEVDWQRRALVNRGSLDITLFNLLVADPSLAAWVRSLLRQDEAPFDPFTQLERRVERVVAELANSGGDDDDVFAEQPRDVAWAATHIARAATAIRLALIRTSSPPEPWERASAARAMVRILRIVVADRRLYSRLIGDVPDDSAVAAAEADAGTTTGTIATDPATATGTSGRRSNANPPFAVDVLELLVDQAQWREELEHIVGEMGALGMRPAYKRRMDGILARLRSNASSSGRASAAASASGSGSGGAGGGGGGGGGAPGSLAVPRPPVYGRRGSGGGGSASSGSRRGAGGALHRRDSTAGTKRHGQGHGHSQDRGSKRPRPT